MKISTLLAGAFLSGVAAVACGMGSSAAPISDSDAGPMGGGGPGGSSADGGGSDGQVGTTAYTFHKDIQPILQEHCQSCHVSGGIAPMPLITYQDAFTYASLMEQKTTAKLMPPWGAQTTADCAPRFGWKNDPSLTTAQISTISSWAEGGAPEGNVADSPAPFTPPSTDLPNTTNTLTPPAPFALDGSSDEFRCFVFDPKLATTMYMNGSQVVPGNPTIVHHVLLYSVPTGVSAIKNTLDASNSYDCFGGPGVAANLVSAWAPGGIASEFPSNVGIPLTAGTALVMQVHYHPHANASMAPDATTFEMRLTATKPEYFIDPVLIGNFSKPVANGTGLLPDPDDVNGQVQFLIPANNANHNETMQFTLPNALAVAKPRIYGIAAHMHLVGVAEQVTLKRAAPDASDPADECLLGVPAWDFNWQRRYDYNTDLTTLPLVSAGDVMTIKCNYNNTMQNAALASSILEQGLKNTSDVVLGETTLDEMCLAPVDFIYKAP